MKGNSTLASLGMLKCIVLPVNIIEKSLPLAKAGKGKETHFIVNLRHIMAK